MNARLIAIAGPLKGKVFPLDRDLVSMGRESSNRVWINDLSVSRRHCQLRMQGDGYLLDDLDSRNGTFVNGVPIKERQLEEGDQIQIADSLFVFLTRPPEVDAKARSEPVEEGEWITRTSIRLRSEDLLYLQPDRMLASVPVNARLVRNLNALLKISQVVNSVRGIEPLQKQLLDCVFETVPAQRAAILLWEENTGNFGSVFGWERGSGQNHAIRISRTIADRVFKEGVALLSNEILENENFQSSESLFALDVRSVLCVPLSVFEKTIGVLYVDASDRSTHFDEDHLQLMAAVARIGALAIANASHLAWLENENQRLQADIRIEHDMVGESPRMKEVLRFISKVAPTDSTVLIEGESGTGKELVARAIHANSPRARKPFVAINCAALTETLLESELFGHERGAFTGAIAQKKGRLEIADTGTVFLDEMGELASSLQAKLLRVIQEHQFDRVGGTRPINVNIRVIAATNRNLPKAIDDKTFRADLYYRLNVLTIRVPPLRERREDISLLVNYFVARYAKKCGRRVLGVSPEARACLVNYSWPGNIRELENAIERSVVLGSADLILPEDLPQDVLEAEPASPIPVGRYHEAVLELKKELILKAVEQSGGNYTEAAHILGVHPNYLHRLIRNMNLRQSLKKHGDKEARFAAEPPTPGGLEGDLT